MKASNDLRTVVGGVPHLTEYFGVWAMHEDTFRSAVEHANSIDLAAHIQAAEPQQMATSGYADPDKSGGIAVIEIRGSLMKFAGSLSGGTGTVATRRAVREAASDDRVKGILLLIDSPGGTVAGTNDLAEDIAAAAAAKPVHTYVEDLCASAAFWLASQTARISAGKTAHVGSIGTFAVVHDLSGMAEQEGIKVHVIRAGTFKGSGSPGTEITDEQLAEWQRIVDGLNEHFVRAVSSGRRMGLKAVRELADGRVHIASDAVKSSLIDAVGSMDDAMTELQRAAGDSTGSRGRRAAANNGEVRMSETNQTESGSPATPVAATYEQLKANLVGADAAFICSQMDARATLDDARSGWMAEQNSRVQAARVETTEAREQAAASAKTIGQPPLGGASDAGAVAESSADAVESFNTAFASHRKSGKARAAAMRATVSEDPDRHAAYLAAHNASRT